MLLYFILLIFFLPLKYGNGSVNREKRKENLSIQQIDQISITILMDNSTDFLLTNSEHVIRPPFIKNDKFVLPPPVAEHGFSALINISKSEQSNTYENYNKKLLF